MTDGVEKKTFSAKQVATRIGTDAKQLRKFLRDPNSGYTPVGQGGRYDFPEVDLPRIKEAFDAWDATKVRRNRTSPEKKLAAAAGLIPGQRKTSPGTDTPPRPRRQTPDQLLKQGLHGNGLDNDSFSERTRGIGARVKRHGLMPNQQGRLVEKPEHILKAEAARIHNRYPDLRTIPGLDKPEARWVDFGEGEEAKLDKLYSDIFEAVGEDSEEELDWEEVED